jgi:hypothetical protein
LFIKTIIRAGFLLLLAIFLNTSTLRAQAIPGCPQAGLLSATACDTSWIDLARLVRDYSLQADMAFFFDANPSSGALPVGQGQMRNGAVVTTSQVSVLVSQTSTYWVVISNTHSQPACSDTASISIPFRPKPQVTLSPSPVVCPGDPVPAPGYNNGQTGTLLLWQVRGGDPDLPGYGFGQVPNYSAKPNLGSTVRYDSIEIFAWRNGCLSDTLLWTPAIKPAPSLTAIPADTVCSFERFHIPLATSPQLNNTSFSLTKSYPTTSLAGNILSDSLNFDDFADFKTFQYNIVPTIDGCSADTGVVEVVIKNAPVELSGLWDTVCSGSPWNYNPVLWRNYPTQFYQWSILESDSQLVFRGNQGLGPQAGDTLANPGSGFASALYEVVPFGNSGCAGLPDTVPVIIRPQTTIGQTDSLFSCADSSGVALFDLSSYPVLFEDRNMLYPIAAQSNFTSTGDTLYSNMPGAGACPAARRIVLFAVAEPAAPTLPPLYQVCDNDVLDINPGPGSFFFYDQHTGQRLTHAAISQLNIPATSSPSVIGISREIRGCEGAISQSNVVVLPSPVLSTSTNAPVCETETLALFADGAFLYLWTGPQQFISTFEDPTLSGATVDLSGQYRVVGVNQFGCRDTAWVPVQVLPHPDPGLDTSIVVCSLDPGFNLFDVLGGNPDRGGIWAGPSALRSGDNGSFDPAVDQSGFYTYSITRNIPCQITQSAVVQITVKNTLRANIEGDTLAPLGGGIRLRGSGGVSYAWTGPNGFSSTAPSPAISFQDTADAGIFRLIVSSPGGCRDTAWHEVSARDTTSLFVRVAALLQGANDSGATLMHDFLRQRMALPLQEPYSARGWFMTEGQGKTMEPSLLLQTGADAPVDWIMVELRLPQHPDSQWRATPGILRRDGEVVDSDGTSPLVFNNTPPGHYMVLIHHRNHLNAISRDSLNFSWRSPARVDFRDPLFPTVGDPHARQIIGGQAWLFAGDANGDGEIQVVDDLFEWRYQAGQGGYLNADYNLDGQVQNSDRLYLWRPNVGRGAFID